MNKWLIVRIAAGISLLLVLAQSQKKIIEDFLRRTLHPKKDTPKPPPKDDSVEKEKIEEKINELEETYLKKCVGYFLYTAINRDSSLEAFETEMFKDYSKEIARPIISWKNEFSFIANKLSLVEDAVEKWLSKQADYKNLGGFIYNEFENFIIEKAEKKADEIIKKIKQ